MCNSQFFPVIIFLVNENTEMNNKYRSFVKIFKQACLVHWNMITSVLIPRK